VSAFDYRGAMADAQAGAWPREQRRRLVDFGRSALQNREQATAFWLNAYNFFMVAHILENPKGGRPVNSVKDYGSLFSPYKVFRRKIFNVGGALLSLDQIEKEILLGDDFKQKGWRDARVHFTVNCASVGCPPLRRQIYLPGNVDEMMTENTRMALNTPRHLRQEGTVLYVTQLFEWYADDFAEAAGIYLSITCRRVCVSCRMVSRCCSKVCCRSKIRSTAKADFKPTKAQCVTRNPDQSPCYLEACTLFAGRSTLNCAVVLISKLQSQEDPRNGFGILDLSCGDHRDHLVQGQNVDLDDLILVQRLFCRG